MMESLVQPASVNQMDVSKYLNKIKEDQKKHHDRHANSELKELRHYFFSFLFFAFIISFISKRERK